jgi:hypothetical protein
MEDAKVKLTDEERKERKKQRNAAYYEKKKDKWHQDYVAKVKEARPAKLKEFVASLTAEERELVSEFLKC